MTANGKYEFNVGSDYLEKQKDQVPAFALWAGLKENTTAHGIPHIDKARGIVKRSVWSVITVTMVALLTYNLYIQFGSFLSYPVSVSLKILHETSLKFPAVTLCNMNPIKNSALQKNPDLLALLDDQQRRKRDLNSKPNGTEPKLCFPKDSCEKLDTGNKKIREKRATNETSATNVRASFEREARVVEYLAGLTLQEKQALGYNVSELILDCEYSGFTCLTSEMSTFHSPTLGNCYTFNSGWSPDIPVIIAHRTGRRYGLKLIVNIIEDEYIEKLGESAGARVIVHPQSRIPFPEDEGLLVRPGEMASVGIRKTEVIRKSHPYGDCIKTEEGALRDVYTEHFAVNYSKTGCYKTCYQKFVIEDCECADPNYPMTGEIFNNVTVPPCGSEDSEQSKCVADITELYNADQLTCDCPNACHDEVFMPAVSTDIWPSRIHKEEILGPFRSVIASMLDDTDNPLRYRENLLKIEVYYEDFNFEVIEELVAYPGGKFLSDMGGILGLWVGCSVMSIFEFVEFALDLFVWAIIRRFPPKRQPKVSMVQYKSDSMGQSSNNLKADMEAESRRGSSRLLNVKPYLGEDDFLPGTPPPPYTHDNFKLGYEKARKE